MKPAEANCKLGLCKFLCPHGTEPSHPGGIKCRRGRKELWSQPKGTIVQCYKSTPGFMDYTQVGNSQIKPCKQRIQKCGRLRDHPKTSWVADVRNLNVFCEKKRKKAQICKFSCSNGRKLSGSPSVVCERTPEGIFLRDAKERPSCK